MQMILLGIDVGTSAIKVSAIDSESYRTLASAQYPENESPILTLETGWAEQSPDMWWDQTKQAIKLCLDKLVFDVLDVVAIGIAYQMHGLVLTGRNDKVLRNSIIWCDSRAVDIGNQAFSDIGTEKCLSHMLNSPGNFTSSKLAWVKLHEPDLYSQIVKVMLPGDYIAMKLTGNITTSISALSEAVLYDFKADQLSQDVMQYFGFDNNILPEIRPVFSEHGILSASVASQLGLKAGIPVAYKAGDQPNNALALNVLQPGEVAATAGTSGVIYGVADRLLSDPQSRVNPFAHVNYTPQNRRLGVLMCINGAGAMYRWVKQTYGGSLSYDEMNRLAANVPIGSDGLRIIPFGNGSERMLCNVHVGAQLCSIDLNLHTSAHIFRAAQEGIACAFRYGLDIMRENGLQPTVIRAGKSNMFLSQVFVQSFVDATAVPVELYNTDGSVGAAIGAGIGIGHISQDQVGLFADKVESVYPKNVKTFETVYQDWLSKLQKYL